MTDGLKEDRHPKHRGIIIVRSQLLVMTAGWFAVGFANAFLVTEPTWVSWIVSVLAVAAGICTTTLAIAPSNVPAYRAGGTFGVGTIGFRILAVLQQAGENLSPHDVVISISITIMFCLLYWQWWLEVVGRWRKITSWRQPPRS